MRTACGNDEAKLQADASSGQPAAAADAGAACGERGCVHPAATAAAAHPHVSFLLQSCFVSWFRCCGEGRCWRRRSCGGLSAVVVSACFCLIQVLVFTHRPVASPAVFEVIKIRSPDHC